MKLELVYSHVLGIVHNSARGGSSHKEFSGVKGVWFVVFVRHSPQDN